MAKKYTLLHIPTLHKYWLPCYCKEDLEDRLDKYRNDYISLDTSDNTFVFTCFTCNHTLFNVYAVVKESFMVVEVEDG